MVALAGATSRSCPCLSRSDGSGRRGGARPSSIPCARSSTFSLSGFRPPRSECAEAGCVGCQDACLVRSLAEWLPWRVLPLAPACATVALMARNAGAALGLVPPLAHALRLSPCQGSDRLGANAQRRAVWVVRMYPRLVRSLAEWLPWRVLPLAPARASVALMARNSGAAL